MPEAPIRVTVFLGVTSDVPGKTGRRVLTASMRLPGVPRRDDRIEMAPGWAAHRVKEVIWTHQEAPCIHLCDVRTDDPVLLAEFEQLIETGRWDCPAGQW